MPSGVPAWAADDQSLFFANAGGQLYRLTIGDQALHPLALRGRAPRPLVNEPNKVVLIRSKTTVKTNGAAADPTRIVLADLDTQQERTVVPAGARTWIACVPSPGGSQLAAVASEGPPAQARRMLYLVRLADGKLDPLGPAASHFSVPTWTPDGSAVVYSREQNGSEDLFLWDVAARKEIQLSRGGGFSAPTVTNDGNLFFLATSGTRPGTMTVRQAPLAVVRKLAAAEPEPRVRGPAVWLEIIEKIGAKNADARLDAAALQRLADAFRRELRERFQETVPDTAQGLEPYLRELAAVPGSPVERAAILHVYAAVGGNYLQRKHGATWQWRAGPFNENATGPDAENAFAVSVNVVQCGEPGKARYPALQAMLDRAEGRALLLVNDAASGREAAAALVDPDLERATKLLNDGKAEEGEKVLLALVEREAHQRNRYLKAHVGMLLYEYGRKDALRRLLDSATERGTVSAGLSNLQGLLVLDTDPRQALVAFKKALRCDLHFEAAYLNLAQAYEQVSDPAAARACLRRYLELFPQGPLSADALERLGKLQ
jgi:tetratricopeptide (TPR) repeat protein